MVSRGFGVMARFVDDVHQGTLEEVASSIEAMRRTSGSLGTKGCTTLTLFRATSPAFDIDFQHLHRRTKQPITLWLRTSSSSQTELCPWVGDGTSSRASPPFWS